MTCKHFISDAACGITANLVPDEDCAHCPIPKLEKAIEKKDIEIAKLKLYAPKTIKDYLEPKKGA
jgi:hypothetical protein